MCSLGPNRFTNSLQLQYKIKQAYSVLTRIRLETPYLQAVHLHAMRRAHHSSQIRLAPQGRYPSYFYPESLDKCLRILALSGNLTTLGFDQFHSYLAS
jgi:hypothetical protein